MRLRGRGLVRLVDLFVAIKETSGDLTVAQMDDLSDDEATEFGEVIGTLLGISEPSTPKEPLGGRTLEAAMHAAGVDLAELRATVQVLAPGTAVGILMFEHTWAIPLRDAIRRAGGVPLVQGFLTQETLVMIGEEVRAIAEAEHA